MKKYLAEFLGTFLLTSIVLLSVSGVFAISTPVLAAVMVCVLVYLFIDVSGQHLNPAVTIAVLSVRKISIRDAAYYLVAQFLAAFLSLKIVGSLVALPYLEAAQSARVGIFEALGTFMLMLSIGAIVYKSEMKPLAGVIIGLGILLGVSFAVLGGTLGIINPAIAVGLRAVNIMYILGPIVGGILGIHVYKKLGA